MPDAGVSPLTAWESFYVIIGSSSAALTGLMFVVISLIPESRTPSSGASLAAFGTPTVMHFCAALLVSAILSAPWAGLSQAGVAVALSGVGGAVYSLIVVRRAWRQTDYRPVLEDWVWHTLLPPIAYVTFLVAGIKLAVHPTGALFGIAAATVLLLFIGIHNAWDTVTYIALERLRSRNEHKGE